GQVVKSKEIVSSALILSLVALLMGFSDYYLEHLGKLLLLPAEYIDLPFRQVLKSPLKVALLSLLVWLTLQGNLASLLRIPACGLDCVAPVSGLMLRQLMLV
ncbi:EscU/YscU/HrcU family type III secretion system export apparatus switch protein, partial [Escherichia coli]